MRMRHTKVFLAVALTSSLILLFAYSNLKEEEVRSQRALEVESVITSGPWNNITLTTTISQPHSHPTTPHKESEAVVISTQFRQAVPQSKSYWNRKLHLYLKQLDGEQHYTKNSTADRTSSWTQCKAVSTESLRTNIQDFNSYPALYQDFLHGMECRDPPILINQPNKCSRTRNVETFLLFAIKSVPRNFERRQAVRETWGREGVYRGKIRVRTIFLLGSWSDEDAKMEKLLSYEARLHGDLLQWDFRDSFYNLTLKENAFFLWALNHCHHVSFIFKGDDDVFANTEAMLDFLQALEPEKASKLYTGHIVTQASPFRDSKSKYYVPQTFYEGAYPAYAGGGGFLFSGKLLLSLYRVSHYIPFFPIDDVYTGMCFQALGINPEAHKGFQTFDIREEDRENPCVHKDLLLVHQRSPRQTLRLWKHMHSPLLTC